MKNLLGPWFFGASWICYFRALKLGDAARVAPIDRLSVVFVAVFAVFFLGERLALPNWLGVILIDGGAVLAAAVLAFGLGAEADLIILVFILGVATAFAETSMRACNNKGNPK